MELLRYRYDNAELGWITDKILLSGSIVLYAGLKKEGRVVIKKSDTFDGGYHMVEVTPNAGPDFELTISGNADGRYIQIITSEEPNYIKYENI